MGRKGKENVNVLGVNEQEVCNRWWHNSASTPGQSELYRTKADTPLLSDFFGVLFVEAALSHLCFVLEAGQLLVSVIRVEKKPRHLRTRLKSHPLHRFGEKIRPDSPSQRSPAASNNRTNGPQARTGSRERGERGRSHR